jgi:hypothetical protein
MEGSKSNAYKFMTFRFALNDIKAVKIHSCSALLFLVIGVYQEEKKNEGWGFGPCGRIPA